MAPGYQQYRDAYFSHNPLHPLPHLVATDPHHPLHSLARPHPLHQYPIVLIFHYIVQQLTTGYLTCYDVVLLTWRDWICYWLQQAYLSFGSART